MEEEEEPMDLTPHTSPFMQRGEAVESGQEETGSDSTPPVPVSTPAAGVHGRVPPSGWRLHSGGLETAQIIT